MELKNSTKEKLDTLIAKYRKKYKIKGLAVSIQYLDTPIYEGLFGEASSNQAVTKETKFMIGSTTKVFTALAILQLMDQGKLTLDDAIKDHLPKLSIKEHKTYDEMTIRHVLMHTSGLPGDDLSMMFDSEIPQQSLIEKLSNHYRTHEPGVMFAYSNIGYALLGLIVEKVSNKSYKEYLKDHIFAPLKINPLILETPKLRSKHKNSIAASYNQKGRTVEDPLSSMISAGTNTYASLNDMQKLASYFLKKNQPKLLNAKTFEAMITPPKDGYMIKNEQRIGLGIRFNYAKFNHDAVGEVYGHGGNTFYHHSLFDLFPKPQLALNIMNNAKKGALFNQKIMPLIIQEIFLDQGIDIPKTIEHPTNPIPLDKRLRYSKDMVMIDRKLSFSIDKNQDLSGKLGFFKYRLDESGDGFLKPVPKGIAKLKPFKKQIEPLRFLPKTVRDEDVLFFEVSSPYKKTLLPLASNYQHPKITEAWQSALGTYRPQGKYARLAQYVKGINLKIKQGALILTLKTPEASNTYYLLPIDEEKAIIQGYGRGTKETVLLKYTQGRPTLMIQGLLCERRKKKSR